MSDSQQSDHWDLLASALGAEPGKKESLESGPQSEQETPSIKSVTNAKSDEERVQNKSSSGQPRPASNWDALAFQLGIEVKSQSPSSAPADLTLSPLPEEKAEAFSEESPENLIPPDEQGDGQTEFKTPSQTFSRPESGEAVEKKSRHHRRRRHKNKDKRKNRAAEPLPETCAETETTSQVKENLDAMLSDIAIEIAEKAGIDGIEDEREQVTTKQLKKHRRSRRGSRKKKKRGGELTQDKPESDNMPDFLERDQMDSEADSTEILADEQSIEEQSDQDSGRSAKSPFRSIPTWDETVGFIITKNMETRPKRHGATPSRSRPVSNPHKKRR